MHPPRFHVQPRARPKRLPLRPLVFRVRNGQLAAQDQVCRQRGVAVWCVVCAAGVGPSEDVREAPGGDEGFGGGAGGGEGEGCGGRCCWHFGGDWEEVLFLFEWVLSG